MSDYLKPSEIVIRSVIIPFPSLLNSAEKEWAVMLLVVGARAAEAHGVLNPWSVWLTWADVRAALLAEVDTYGPLLSNPFFNVDLHGLVGMDLIEFRTDGPPAFRVKPKLLDMIAVRKTVPEANARTEAIARAEEKIGNADLDDGC